MSLFKFFQLTDIEEPLQGKQLKKTAFEAYDMKKSFITLDQAFDYVGDNSRYQKRITSILSIQWLFYAFFVMGMPVLFENPAFFCERIGGLDTPELFACSEQQVCSGGVSYAVIGFDSITKELELYCDKKYYLGIIASAFFFGQALAGMIFPILANYYGRKKIIIFGILLGASSIIIGGVSINILMLVCCFFFTGFGLSGYETVVYVYITEISASRFRSISTNVLVIVWASSMFVFPTLASLLRTWRIVLIFGIGIPLILGAFICAQAFFESPRWLASQQRFDDCREVLRKVSIFNSRKPFDFNFVEEMDNLNNQTLNILPITASVQKKPQGVLPKLRQLKSSGSYFQLCQNMRITKITLVLILSWFLRYFTYYGIQFSLQTFGMSVSYSLLFIGFAEVLGAFISGSIVFIIVLAYFKLRMKRVTSLSICLLIMTLCCLFFYFVRIPHECLIQDQFCRIEKSFSFLMAFILKFATTFYMTTLNTYTGEVYPTSIRTYGYGLCMSLGQIGSTIVPLYVQYELQNDVAVNPLTNISVFSFFCFLLTRNLLPETFKQQMFEDIQDDSNTNYQRMEQEMAQWSPKKSIQNQTDTLDQQRNDEVKQ